MSGQSVTKIIGGPALVTYRGATFYSQSDIKLSLEITVFAVEVDAFREVDQRVKSQPVKISFTPAGEWESLTTLYPYWNIPFGDLITPVRSIGTITGNVAYVPNNLLQSGDAVYVSNVGGALPTGLAASTIYYVHIASADSLTFHTTRANAVAGTNVIAISGGTGTNRLVVNNPLIIQTMDPNNGQLITFFNAAVTKMPNITGSAVKTILGEVEFEAFLLDGAAPSTSGSLYSIVTSPFQGDTTFNPANVLTQQVTVAWGAVLPWSNFFTKTGIMVDFALSLEDVDIDGLGILTKRIAGLKVTAKGEPVGVSESDVATALLLQGAGAGIGRSLNASASTMTLSAPGFNVTIFGAALQGGPLQFSSKSDRVGELTWVATRTFTGGVPNPIFYVDANSVS